MVSDRHTQWHKLLVCPKSIWHVKQYSPLLWLKIVTTGGTDVEYRDRATRYHHTDMTFHLVK